MTDTSDQCEVRLRRLLMHSSSCVSLIGVELELELVS